MAGFIIKLGKEFPTDNTLCINEKEYAINSIAWQLIDRIHQYLGFDDTTPSILLRYQGILKVIYDNFDHDLINKPVETTNEQPIDFNKLSKIKQELLLSCYYALQCIDDLKVKPLEIDIEEECAVTTRRTIEIRVGSIDFGVKVNNIDVIDKNIEW